MFPNCYQVVAAPGAANSGSASQKEFEKLFEAYAAKNPANGQPNPNCRMKVIRDAICGNMDAAVVAPPAQFSVMSGFRRLGGNFEISCGG